MDPEEDNMPMIDDDLMKIVDQVVQESDEDVKPATAKATKPQPEVPALPKDHFCIKGKQYARLANEIVKEINPDVKILKKAMQLAHSVCEAKLMGTFLCGNEILQDEKITRKTLKPRHVEHVMRMDDFLNNRTGNKTVSENISFVNTVIQNVQDFDAAKKAKQQAPPATKTKKSTGASTGSAKKKTPPPGAANKLKSKKSNHKAPLKGGKSTVPPRGNGPAPSKKNNNKKKQVAFKDD